MGLLKIFGWLALVLTIACLQGVAVFWFQGFDGSLLSVTGLKCAAIPAAVELVVLVVVMKNLDELHGRAASDPHSLLGQALRKDAARSPAAPTARDSWDGGFEDMHSASDKMAKDR